MTFRNTTAVFGLFILLVIASCKEPDGIGLDVLPAGEQMPIAWIDTFTIEARTVLYDSVVSSGLTTYLLGDFGDPIFGRVTSELYTQVRLPSVPFDPGSGSVIDSVILNLPYSGSYGNTSKLGGTMRFGVYNLITDLADSTYYSNATEEFDPIPLAEFDLRPNLFSNVIAGDETLSPALRVRIDDSFGQAVLDLGAGSTELGSNEEFVKKIKGIAVKPINASMLSGLGSILYFGLTGDEQRVELYYHNNDEDSLFIQLEIGNNSGFASPRTFFQHEFPTTITSAIEDSTVAGANTLYVQSMAGLRIKLEIPNLKELNNLGVVAITTAELVVPIDESVITKYDYPTSMFVTGINESGNSSIVVDQFDQADYYDGTYDSDNGEYVFNISRHIQSILSSPEEPDYGLYIVNAGNSTNARRGVFNGPQHPTKPMKLRMTYTIIE